jgi:ferredoxin
MASLTNRVKVLEQQPLSFMERLYLPAIFKGMAITFSHIFKKKATIRYPEEKRPFSPVFRGLQVLNRDEEGRENCTACGLCAVACPAEAITMKAEERKAVGTEAGLFRITGSPLMSEVLSRSPSPTLNTQDRGRSSLRFGKTRNGDLQR